MVWEQHACLAAVKSYYESDSFAGSHFSQNVDRLCLLQVAHVEWIYKDDEWTDSSFF